MLGDAGDPVATSPQERDVDAVILAIPQRHRPARRRRRRSGSQAAGLEFLVLPRVSELIGGRVSAGDIRQVEIGDVLGRHQVSTNLGDIADYLTGKRVLITGAGGSIGSELARQVHKFGPATLIMLDRDESALHAVQLSIYGHGLLDDARHRARRHPRHAGAATRSSTQHRPEIVFHAAALKHLPMLERFPDEGWKTNVLGTLNLLRLSAQSRRRALREHLHRQGGRRRRASWAPPSASPSSSPPGTPSRRAGRYISVRFGNVLGSRGSMLHTFNAQIEAGGPITVTHPDVTRYFMTIPEACELVVQAGAIGRPGEVMVLDMGDAGEDPRRRQADDRAVRRQRRRDRLHRPAPGREAARGALLRRASTRAPPSTR